MRIYLEQNFGDIESLSEEKILERLQRGEERETLELSVRNNESEDSAYNYEDYKAT
jgi:hypothetical protein